MPMRIQHAAAEVKAAHSLVNYSPISIDQYQCQNCAHYMPPHTCEAVASPIDPRGWCAWYLRANISNAARSTPVRVTFTNDPILTAAFAAPLSRLANARTRVPHFTIERERKFSVNEATLPATSQVAKTRTYVQGYWTTPTDSVSLRLVPQKHKAKLRKKSLTPSPDGSRLKVSTPVKYRRALADIQTAPAVALKTRSWYTHTDGRIWKIDRFDDGHVQAETEAQDGPNQIIDPSVYPPFVTAEHTGDPAYYSRAHARPRTPDALARALNTPPPSA